MLGQPVYKLLGGPNDSRGVRGYYHIRAGNRQQRQEVRDIAKKEGITCFKGGIPGYYEWIETHDKISRAIQSIADLREIGRAHV